MQRVPRKASEELVIFSTFLLHYVSFSVNKMLRKSPLLFIGWWVFHCVLSPAMGDLQMDCILLWLFSFVNVKDKMAFKILVTKEVTICFRIVVCGT